MEAGRNALIVSQTQKNGADKFDQICKENPSLLEKLNQITGIAGLKFYIQLNEQGSPVATSRLNGEQFPIPQLSDGERSALIMCADTLTQDPGKLILIDEPERHLHRSISARLIDAMVAARKDCYFVISTHDIDLVRPHACCQIIVLRGYEAGADRWIADILPDVSEVGPEVIEALVGAREELLFVEGNNGSPDIAIYDALYPERKVIAAGSCTDVERVCRGLREAEGYHWISASGIVDGDNSDDNRIRRNAEIGVTTLPYASVEALYLHPNVLASAIAKNTETGLIEQDSVNPQAIQEQVVAIVSREVEAISARLAERRIRQAVLEQLPTRRDILDRDVEPTLAIDVEALVASAHKDITEAVGRGYERILEKCPLKQTQAMAAVARALGYSDFAQMKRSIALLLRSDDALRVELAALVGADDQA